MASASEATAAWQCCNVKSSLARNTREYARRLRVFGRSRSCSPLRSAAVPISHSRIAASEAISTSTVKRPAPLEALHSRPSPKCWLFMSRKLSSICMRCL
jgi:hypothetical protein